MIKRYFPPVRETMLVVVITVVFLLLTATCIGLRPEHFLMAGLFFVLFFAGKTTRKLAVALLPFIIFGVSYDWTSSNWRDGSQPSSFCNFLESIA